MLLGAVDHVLANDPLAVIKLSIESTIHLNIVDLEDPPGVAENCRSGGTHIRSLHERTHAMTVNVEWL